MRLAIDIRPLAQPHHSGVDRYTIETINALAAHAPEIKFVLFASGTKKTLGQLPPFSARNIEVVHCRIPNRLLYLILFLRLRTLESFLPKPVDAWWFPNLNILHTHLPFALTAHDLSFHFAPEFFSWKTRLWHWCVKPAHLYQKARVILSVSERTKQDLIKFFSVVQEKIHVTPLGVQPHFHPNQESSDITFLRSHGISFPYFLTLCTREPRKNLVSVIEAYAAYRTSSAGSTPNPSMNGGVVNPIPHLVLAGSAGWMTEDLKKRIETSGFAQDIHVIGYVPEEHKPALYRHATAFFFPSFYEGFGLPVLEAMACKTPVVASFAGAIPEVTQDAAILIDPYHVNEITQAMNIVEDDKTRNNIGARGSNRAKNFRWKDTAEKTGNILKSLR